MDLKALQEYALKHRCNKLGEYADEYKKIVPSIEEIKKVIDNLKLN